MAAIQPDYSKINKELKLVETSLKLPECSAENRQLVEKILQKLTNQMKEKCSLFKNLYQEVTYQGSYFDGLRIKEATEFDINFVLSFNRVLKLKLKVVSDDKPAGFGKVQLEQPLEKYSLTRELHEKIKGFFDQKNYLLPDKINQFMQSTIDTTLTNFNIQNEIPGVTRVQMSASGPARTLKIHTKDGQRIDLDLVPVLKFGAADFPNSLRLPENVRFEESDKEWYMVPKKYKSGWKQNPKEPRAEDIPRLWRMHFPSLEKRIMWNVKCVKPLIKILKLLRDAQDWKSIASYYLKTVVLLEVIKNNNTNHWDDVKMGERFVEALSKLKSYTEKKSLPYLMFPTYNLFCGINPAELENLQNRINRILKCLSENPNKISEFCKLSH